VAVTGIAAPIVTFHAKRNIQERRFRAAFDHLADSVASALAMRLGLLVGSADALSVSMTSQAQAANATWPFFTMNDSDLVGSNTLRMSGGIQLRIHPIVTDETRSAWEEYATTNMGYLWNELVRYYNQCVRIQGHINAASRCDGGSSSGKPSHRLRMSAPNTACIRGTVSFLESLRPTKTGLLWLTNLRISSFRLGK